jgi:NAD-dependent deacetylase
LRRVVLSQYRNIVILTGAGISAASGVRTFRGAGGLWEEMDPAEVGSLSALKREPKAVWQLFGPLRRQLRSARPSAAHEALAAAEARLAPAQRWTLLTQNVDGLHQRAGSRAVVELHGTIHRTRCSREDCSLPPFEDAATYDDNVPPCPRCGSPLRPDLVLFEEPIPVAEEMRAKAALRECDLFIAVGTSGVVTPAANFVRSAQYAGARTILVNLEPMQPRNRYFQEEYLGRAEEVLPHILDG